MIVQRCSNKGSETILSLKNSTIFWKIFEDTENKIGHVHFKYKKA